jgi:hypothetical protein
LNSHLALIGKNLITLIRLVDYRTFLICLGITLLLWLLIWIGMIDPAKQVLEIAAVVISGILTIGLIGRYAFTRHLFLLWAAGFMAIAMSREIHFSGSDEILLIGWPIMLVIGLWRYDLFKSYLKNPVLINFLAGGFLLYLISQTIDQRWWRGVPGEDLVHVPLEELMEILGHCTVGLAMLLCKESPQSDKEIV